LQRVVGNVKILVMTVSCTDCRWHKRCCVLLCADGWIRWLGGWRTETNYQFMTLN